MISNRPCSSLSLFSTATTQKIDFSITMGPKDILHPVCVYDAGSHYIAVFGIERTEKDQGNSPERFHASCEVPVTDGKKKSVIYRLFYVADRFPWENEGDDDIGHFLFHISNKTPTFTHTCSLRPAWKYPLVYVNTEGTERLALNMSLTANGRDTLARSSHDRACLPADLSSTDLVSSPAMSI